MEGSVGMRGISITWISWCTFSHAFGNL